MANSHLSVESKPLTTDAFRRRDRAQVRINRIFADADSLTGSHYRNSVFNALRSLKDDDPASWRSAANALRLAVQSGIATGPGPFTVEDWEDTTVQRDDSVRPFARLLGGVRASFVSREQLITFLTPAHLLARAGLYAEYMPDGHLVDRKTGSRVEGEMIRPVKVSALAEPDDAAQIEPNWAQELERNEDGSEPRMLVTSTLVPFPEHGLISTYWPMFSEGYGNPYGDSAPSARGLGLALIEELEAASDSVLIAAVVGYLTGVCLNAAQPHGDEGITLRDDYMYGTVGPNWWALCLGADALPRWRA